MAIIVKNPIVEMDGDEMTRIIWKMIKDKLLLPHLKMDLKYYDLGVKHRDETDDQVTIDAANAVKEYSVGVKCATITPNAARVKEYSLKQAWKSPNGTIRSILDGTVFRKPIIVKNIPPAVRSWKKPISIGRHAYGDIYKSVEFKVPGAGKAELVYHARRRRGKSVAPDPGLQGAGRDHGHAQYREVDQELCQGLHQLRARREVRSLVRGKGHHFQDLPRLLQGGLRPGSGSAGKADFDKLGIKYRYMLIDDAVAQIMKAEGGMLWACMNYDGDVMSDMVASGFGSLGLMTSVLVSPDGKYVYEAAHGTVMRHYYEHLKGNPTSTNSVASIFAWTGAIARRGELDGTPDVVKFAQKLESSRDQDDRGRDHDQGPGGDRGTEGDEVRADRGVHRQDRGAALSLGSTCNGALLRDSRRNMLAPLSRATRSS